jgi:hypothetical protein
MDNQPYTYDDDSDFKFCQCCGQLFLRGDDDNNEYCPYCVASKKLIFDRKCHSWRRDPSVWEED